MTTTQHVSRVVSRNQSKTRGWAGKAVGVLIASMLLLATITFFVFSGVMYEAALVIALIWVVVVTLILAGADGREETQRIVESPFDERERAIRTKALGIGLAAVTLINLGWVVYGIADGHNVTLPVLTVVAAGASIIVAIEFLRRRSLGPGESDRYETAIPEAATVDAPADARVDGDELDEQIGRPTWLATTFAWVLGTLASEFASVVVLGALRPLGVPYWVFSSVRAVDQFGAQGLPADAAFATLAGALVVVGALVYSLTASRWLDRAVSFGWMLVIFLVEMIVGIALLRGTEGSLWNLPFYFLAQLLALRFVAGRTTGVRGLAARLKLSRRLLATVSIGTLFGLIAVAAFGTTHPLSVEMTTSVYGSRGAPHGQPKQPGGPNSPYVIDLPHDPVASLEFRTVNRGVGNLRFVHVVGLRSIPPGAATITALKPGRGIFDFGPPSVNGLLSASMSPHGEKRFGLWIAFACAAAQRRQITIDGLNVNYRALDRDWNSTLPLQKLIARCPR